MNNTKTLRESNLELLRLVAIVGIVFHHLLIKGAGTVGYLAPYDYARDGWVGVLINSLVIGGVNCFILITGWFGIKSVSKGVVRLLVDCIVFGAISYLLLVTTGHNFVLHELKASMEFDRNWFIMAYMMLLFVAPIIESSLKGVSVRTLGYWVSLLTVFNLYFGYHLQDTNPNGYCVVNFVYLYYIARFMRLAYESRWMKLLTKWSVVGYLICTFLLTAGFVGMGILGKPRVSLHWFAYNAPLVLGLSVFEFLFFSKIRIQSKFINLLATGVFGTFILHTTCCVVPVRNEWACGMFMRYGYWGIAIMAGLIVLIGLPISVVVTRVNSCIVAVAVEKCQCFFSKLLKGK